ncbi:hypothetical protein PIIN_09809 [Serendipita indica DSM 11827]|uniref:Uncharacterized protein n=1 Tax=Serendipita indica (strain DSM 11827) TaxID=1109443 RepID=G4TWX8_SERID|nr:hypothetical protein PIIN_09809 [Serendipita indica DSM 11827]
MDLAPESNEGPMVDSNEGSTIEIDQYMTGVEEEEEIIECDDIGNDGRPMEPVLGTPRRLSEPPDESELYCETIAEAGRVISEVEPKFVTQAAEHVRLGGSNPYHPFRDETDFELAKFLHNSGLSMNKIDELLKLKYFCARPPSYATASALRKLIERCPDGSPRWRELGIIPDFGAPSQPLTLLYRDPVQAISHLLSRPALANHMTFAPKRFWTDQSKTTRVYSDFYSGNWWYTTQQRLPEGQTVIPVILGSDKTHLTEFTGDKKAWPLYLSIGNIAMSARSSPAYDAWMLIAYIPVPAWKDSKKIQKTLSARLFHQCMKLVLNPLVEPGKTGIEMADASGKVRICVPLVAGYISDYPEQTLINCTANNVSSVFLAGNKDLGSPTRHPPRTSEWILDQIKAVTRQANPNDIPHYQDIALAHGLSGVHKPFWASLPHYRADICLGPDIFHGPIRFGRDYILEWYSTILAKG